MTLVLTVLHLMLLQGQMRLSQQSFFLQVSEWLHVSPWLQVLLGRPFFLLVLMC